MNKSSILLTCIQLWLGALRIKTSIAINKLISLSIPVTCQKPRLHSPKKHDCMKAYSRQNRKLQSLFKNNTSPQPSLRPIIESQSALLASPTCLLRDTQEIIIFFKSANIEGGDNTFFAKNRLRWEQILATFPLVYGVPSQYWKSLFRLLKVNCACWIRTRHT